MTSERIEQVLSPAARLEKLGSGASWSEGPLWLPRENALIWSDIPGNRIMRWSESDGVCVWRDDVEFTNGRTLAADGSIITCSHGRRAVERWSSSGTEEPTCLVDSWNDLRLNSPNDVVLHSDGSIWFTDPPYGIVAPHEGHAGEREYGDHWVFRFDPATCEIRPVVIDVEEPNGLAFSPDESVLYVTDTSAALAEPGRGHRLIRAYDVTGGRCKNGRDFAVMTDGLADGLRVDALGNLWTSHGSAVSVIAPDGAWLTTIDVPETVGNLCFGGLTGSDLFIAATTSIYRLPTLTVGAELRWVGREPSRIGARQ